MSTEARSPQVVGYIDGQVHANALRHTEGESLDSIVTSTVAAMDAVGLAGAIVDDYDGWHDEHMLPGHFADNGAWKADLAFSKRAVELFPDRFGYMAHVELADPDMKAEIANLKDAPGCLGLRLLYGPGPLQLDPAFGAGSYDAMFAAAAEHEVPVFVYVSGGLDGFLPYVERNPDTRFVIDHLGVGFPVSGDGAARRAAFEPVLRFADHGNVYLKWCHVEWLSEQASPFSDAWPHLRRAVNEFGADRVLWASDYTVACRDDLFTAYPPSWGGLLDHVSRADVLTEAEKAWVLGGTVSKLLGWQPNTTKTSINEES